MFSVQNITNYIQIISNQYVFRFNKLYPKNGHLDFSPISPLQLPAKIGKTGAVEIKIRFLADRRHEHYNNESFCFMFSYNNILRK